MCPKPAPGVIILRNTLIVFVVFMLIDYLYYGLLNPGQVAYSTDLVHKIIYSLLASIAFAHLYNKASRIWRPNSDEAFIYHKGVTVPESELCKTTGIKLLNGLIFSLLVCAVVIFAMMLSTFVISNLFIYVLHGVRGDISQLPGGMEGTCLLVGKIVISGMALEMQGKTEDDPDR